MVRTMAKPRFAFLLLEEHPYGREMLSRIIAAGHIPILIIEESSEIANQEREKFINRISGHPIAPTIQEQAGEHAITVEKVQIHCDAEVMPIIEDLPLDLIVFGGTRIIRGAILDYPRYGVINSHPGLLPECRGSASPAWSVLHDIRIGSSTHFCDNGIDTGDLLLRREAEVRRGATYEDLCYYTLVLAGFLMAEALVAYDKGRWPDMRRQQGESPWPTFKNADPEVLAEVRRKLAECEYAHYVD